MNDNWLDCIFQIWIFSIAFFKSDKHWIIKGSRVKWAFSIFPPFWRNGNYRTNQNYRIMKIIGPHKGPTRQSWDIFLKYLSPHVVKTSEFDCNYDCYNHLYTLLLMSSSEQILVYNIAYLRCTTCTTVI